MSNIAIKAENLSKAYQLGQIGTGTISRDLERWYARVRGKEDPFLKIGEANDRTSKGSSDIVWSLKDINFEIEQGDAVGIIGRNGAGKSTLLKVLSRVTSPTTGRITGKGRIASLLEVGTGFHPELTGRENIYLNGAILGMRKREITRKFDEIVDFAGVERYIDTPVKRYSSGMYVRLAFAVAAHLESEILIVDEVLAVGDAEFQKKCLGKMGDVNKGEGRTVLFVSHNIASIRNLCRSGILLQNGLIACTGEVEKTINEYLKNNLSSLKSRTEFPVSNESWDLPAVLKSCYLSDEDNVEKIEFDVFEKVYLNIRLKQLKLVTGMNLSLIVERNGETLFISFDTDLNKELIDTRETGEYEIRVHLPNPLKAGNYNIASLSFGVLNIGTLQSFKNILSFNVAEISFNPAFASYSLNRPGVLATQLKWNYSKL